VVTLSLTGCGGLPAQSNEPQDKGTVVVTIGPAGTNEPLDVDAVVICGGVRGEYHPGDAWVTLENVPLGVETPPRQPLTVTAQGYRTESQWVVLNVSAATYVDVGLTAVDLAQTGTVQGQVTDAQTGQPVVNAHLQFAAASNSQTGDGADTVEGFTDAEGKYIIGGIPVGQTTLTAGAEGYLQSILQVNVQPDDGGQNAPVNIALVAGNAKVQVRGVVVDVATQLPIEGAQVQLGDQQTITGSDGTFTIEDVPVGEKDLTVTAEGYEKYQDTVKVLPGMGVVRVEMVESAPEPPGPPHNVTGTVEIRNRPDSSGAVVSAYNLQLGQVMDQYTTGADGRYYLLVPPGDYEIRVNYEGQELVRRLTVPGGGRVVSGVDFVVSAPPQ